jgi:broad specificity phosphatase PhoE
MQIIGINTYCIFCERRSFMPEHETTYNDHRVPAAQMTLHSSGLSTIDTMEIPESLLTNDPTLPANTKRIYLIRHAHAGYEYQKATIPMDPPITAIGTLQLQALQHHFMPPELDMLVSSELQRTQKTAQALLATYPGVPLIIEPGFNEVHTIGDWRKYNEQETSYLINQRLYQPDQGSPLGETPRHFHRRVSSAWERIVAGKARNIAIVTHSGVLGVIVSLAFGVTEDQETYFALAYPNAALSEIWVADTRDDPTLPDRVTIIRSLCYADYLQPDLITY